MLEKFDFPYSLKNIPIPTQTEYKKILIQKSEEFINRFRWAAEFALRPRDSQDDKELYGFKSAKSPPKVPEIEPFENEFFEMVGSVSFTSHRTMFQRKLAKKKMEIESSEKVFILGDKTSNIYKVSPEQYNKLILENITKDYAQVPESKVREVNLEAKEIATKLGLADRIEQHSRNEGFISVKDHKFNFENDPKCRLINPAKSQIGKISKIILERINTKVRETTKLQQWRSTKAALEWFNKLEQKPRKRFLQLDVDNFYVNSVDFTSCPRFQHSSGN